MGRVGSITACDLEGFLREVAAPVVAEVFDYLAHPEDRLGALSLDRHSVRALRMAFLLLNILHFHFVTWAEEAAELLRFITHHFAELVVAKATTRIRVLGGQNAQLLTEFGLEFSGVFGVERDLFT